METIKLYISNFIKGDLTIRYSIKLNSTSVPSILGQNDLILRRLEEAVRSRIVVRGNEVFIEGPSEEEMALRQIFRDLEGMAQHKTVDLNDLDAVLILAGITRETPSPPAEMGKGILVYERPGLRVFTKSVNQEAYIQAMQDADLVFAVGPAGTGKTYLAVAQAVRSFLSDEVERIILVRPVVEAGENLGFLPGDLKEKVEPYFRPLYDALLEMIPPEKLKKYMDLNQVEVAPLAYMRGRTLSKAFVILDEAQNTTSDQLKMFLTRLGVGTKAIVTGDLTQIDLVDKTKSGLAKAIELLSGIRRIRSVSLSREDVVRHPLVREIIRAYERDAEENGSR